MKRLQTCKKVNRNNNSIFNNISRRPPRINTITPEILIGQIWLQDDEPSQCIEIVELHSSDEADMTPQHVPQDDDVQEKIDNPFCDLQDDHLSHAWCYVNNNRAHDVGDKYKLNKKARERRRLNVQNHRVPTNSLTNINEYGSDNFSNIYDTMSSNPVDEKITLNHQMNYFTILNKHLINSDTSSDIDYGDVEITTSGDIITETCDDWNHNGSYEEEIITYDPDLDKETRTIWIYSFKNKHLLSENEMEMVNTSGKNTSSCSTPYSFESDDDKTANKSTSVSRVCSPIPTIPRLNLSLEPVLSTVTEVTESYKQISSNETKSSAKDIIRKPKNSWTLHDSVLATERPNKISHRHEKSTNIVNWLALSPREKTRRFNYSGDKWKGSILQLEQSFHSERSVIKENSQNESGLVETVEVQVDVHVSEKSPIQRSLRTTKSEDAATKPTDIDTTQMIKDTDLNFPLRTQDRGDHEAKLKRKPQIVVSNKLMVNAASITDPIEKLDSCNWIYEEKVEKQTATYDYTLEEVEVDSKNYENNELNVTWIKNSMGLMKPALWTEYLPISNTPLSLHLSLSSIAESKRQSWFKRLVKCIICCK